MKIKTLEKKLGMKLKRNYKVLGLDTASRTGWALLTTDKTDLYIETGFIKVDSKNVYFKYNEIIKIFADLIKEEYQVIVEDTFYRFNPKMFRLISRIGAIAYTLAYLRNCNVSYLLATSARKRIGCKGNAKKIDVAVFLKENIKLDIKDDDIADAVILGLNGLLVEDKGLF